MLEALFTARGPPLRPLPPTSPAPSDISMAIGSDIPYYFLPSPKFPTPSKIHNPVTTASSNTGKKLNLLLLLLLLVLLLPPVLPLTCLPSKEVSNGVTPQQHQIPNPSKSTQTLSTHDRFFLFLLLLLLLLVLLPLLAHPSPPAPNLSTPKFHNSKSSQNYQNPASCPPKLRSPKTGTKYLKPTLTPKHCTKPLPKKET